MKKVFGLIISAALIFGAVPAGYAAEEPAQAEAVQEETFSITAAGCIAFKGDEALEENKAPAGTELTFRLEKDLAENEGLSWAVQFSDGSEFEDFKESEDGKSITLAMPEKDIIVTAQIGEIIESDEADTSGMNFSDVKESDWFYGAVKEMFEGNYMGGTSDSKYEPKSEGKRSEIVTVLYRLDGSQKAEGQLKFSDITKNTELADAAVWASQSGIAAGYPDGTFKPDQSVSRQELAIFIYKYAQY
ncbi:MAG: S-layer homology domain-containing protein, partial [Firmicutes bacterium]|nr:S-layer homology domain-containing protein [Bacillota bacterium]